MPVPAGQAMTAALDAGVRFFQYRAKHQPRRQAYEECLVLSRIARNAGALFIVNDYADIAVAAGADGVHLGQDDMPLADARRITGSALAIGISTHSREQALIAERSGADYIGFGPIFKTATKDAGKTQGIEALAMVKQAVSIPVIAIGGITAGNVKIVLAAGAAGAAVISAILKAPDIGSASAELVHLTETSFRGGS